MDYRSKRIPALQNGSNYRCQRDTVLNISQGSTFLPVPDQAFNAQFNIGTNNPQGGFAGLAIHPNFLMHCRLREIMFTYPMYIRYGGGSPPVLSIPTGW